MRLFGFFSTPAAGPKPLPPVLAHLAQLKQQRRKTMLPEVFALHLVAYMQAEGFEGFHLPEDIDEVAAHLFEVHGVEPLRSHVVRESVLAVPGVQHYDRLRLIDRPELGYIRQRLRCKGRNPDRATLYFIPAPKDEAAPAQLGHATAAAAPPARQHAREDRSGQREGGGTRGGTAPARAAKPKKTRTIADVRAAGEQPLRKVA